MSKVLCPSICPSVPSLSQSRLRPNWGRFSRIRGSRSFNLALKYFSSFTGTTDFTGATDPIVLMLGNSISALVFLFLAFQILLLCTKTYDAWYEPLNYLHCAHLSHNYDPSTTAPWNLELFSSRICSPASYSCPHNSGISHENMTQPPNYFSLNNGNVPEKHAKYGLEWYLEMTNEINSLQNRRML